VAAIEFDRSIRKTPWTDQAVLFRTNAQSRALETALRQSGVRYHLVGGQSFFDRREIREFLAYLKMFVNPHDDISLLRIANVPARGLSDTTMQRLLTASHERHSSVYAVMRRPDPEVGLTTRAQASLKEFVDWVETTRAALTADPALDLRAWAEQFLRGCGYVEEVRRSEKDTDAAEGRVRNLLDLAASLADIKLAAPPAERLERFLEDLTLDREREQEEQAGDAVTLITMHSCKGLEFPHVHIVGIEEGLLPHSRSQEEGTLDEERRLFYVAITRAMRTLALSHCGARRRHGQAMPCHPSRFLKELPEHLVESGSSRRPVSPENARSIFAGLHASLDAIE
jgi:DNA helicase II / ATP-dependent DNA helicase PcrA